MPFVPNDPPEFLHYPRMKEVLCHHEAGHLFLAFYYGYQIAMFRFWDNKKDVWGAVRNQRTDAPPAKETLENLNNEVRKLLAGEAAARIHLKLPKEEFVLPLYAPKSNTVTKDTPFEDLKYTNGSRRYDGIKILAIYDNNREIITENWWTWFWGRHAETKTILEQNWEIVSALAKRLLTVDVDAYDKACNAMQGYTPGQKLIEWCQEIGVPVLNQDIKSVSYKG